MRVDSMGTVEREQRSAYISLGSVWSVMAWRDSHHKPTLLPQALLGKRTSNEKWVHKKIREIRDRRSRRISDNLEAETSSPCTGIELAT